MNGSNLPAFHVLAKPTGAKCNLNCKYCFYLEKEELYPKSDFKMGNEVLEEYIKQLFEGHRTREVAVAWQGGEPTLMGLDFFKRSVELVQKYKRPDQVPEYTLQTNGTLLDDEWCVFFAENNFLIGLSLDGPGELHDTNRMNKGGAGSFDEVIRGLEFLKKHRVDFNILCTINSCNVREPLMVYKFFRDDVGAEFVQFIPIVEWMGNELTPESVGAKDFGKFLCDIFDEWVNRDIGEVYVQHFDAALANRYGTPPGICVFSETCGTAVALEHNGDVYSCDHFVNPQHKIGNILKDDLADVVSGEEQFKFGQDKRNKLPEDCLNCEIRFACHGGCPKNRDKLGKNVLCEGYKIFFEHTREPMKKMARLLREGRAPREMMDSKKV